MLSSVKRKGRAEFYFRKEKEAIHLLKRANTLSKLRWQFNKANLIKLEKPIRRGFIRHFVVRPDLERSNKARMLNRILPLIQNPTVCDRKDFTTNRVDGRKVKKPVHIDAEIHDLSQYEYDRIPDDLKHYFHMTERVRRWGGPIKVWAFAHPWMFTTRVKPHWITHGYILHNEIIAEYEYIMDKLYNSDMLALKFLNIGNGFEEGWDDTKRNKMNRILDKEIREELDEVKNNQIKEKYNLVA